MANIIIFITLIGGVIALFRQSLLIYLFAAYPAFIMTFSLSEFSEEAEIKLLEIGSLNIFATDFLVLILLIMLIFATLKLSTLKMKGLSILIAGPINKIIFIMFAWDIIIGIISYQKGFYIQNVLRRLSTESLMFLAVLIPQIKNIDFKKDNFYKFLSLLGIMLVVTAIWRNFVTHEVGLTSSGTSRAITGNSVLIMIIPICYFLLNRSYSNKNTFSSYAIIVLMIIGIFLAAHRSGFIVLFFIFCMWYIYNRQAGIELMFIPLWAGAIGIITLFFLSTISISGGKSFIGDAGLRFKDTFNLENSTTVDRFEIWKYCLEIAMEKPLMGIASFPAYKKKTEENIGYSPPAQTKLRYPPHNIFVDKFLYEGIIGLSLVIILFYIIYKQTRIVSTTDYSYANFLMTYLFAFLIFSNFNTNFSDHTGRTYFFIMLGFLNSKSVKILNSFNEHSPQHAL